MSKLPPSEVQRAEKRGAVFTKISAVEGIRLTPKEQQMFNKFQRDGTPYDVRRGLITAKPPSKKK